MAAAVFLLYFAAVFRVAWQQAAVVPSAPSLELKSVSTGSVQLKLNPGHDGGDAIRGYVLHYKSNSEADWQQVQVPLKEDTYERRGLHCGIRYKFYLTTFNGMGVSEPSQILEASTQGSAPPPEPKGRRATTNGTHFSVQLSEWPDGGCPIQNFVVSYRCKGEAKFVQVSDKLPPTRETIVVSDVRPESDYEVRITASNEAGSTDNDFRVKTLPAEFSPAPKDVLISKLDLPPTSLTSKLVKWSLSVYVDKWPYRGCPVHEFQVDTKFPGQKQWNPVPNEQITNTSKELKFWLELNPSTLFKVRLTEKSKDRHKYSAVYYFATPNDNGEIPFPPPGDFLITPGSTSVTVHLEAWLPIPSCYVDFYQIQYKTPPLGQWTKVDDRIDPAEKEIVIRGLTPETKYDLRVSRQECNKLKSVEYGFDTLPPSRAVSEATAIPKASELFVVLLLLTSSSLLVLLA